MGGRTNNASTGLMATADAQQEAAMMKWRLISLAVAFTVLSGCASGDEPSWYEFEVEKEVKTPKACSTSLTVKVLPKAGSAVLSVPKETAADKYELVDVYFGSPGQYEGVPAGCLDSTRFYVKAQAEEVTVEVIDTARAADPTKVPRMVIITLPNGQEAIGSKVWWAGGGILGFETF